MTTSRTRSPDDPAPGFHGRRQGRPLRPARRRLLTKRLPALRVPVPEDGRLQPAAFFPSALRDIWLEIGFGGGEHLAAQAERHRDTGFLGCDLFTNGIASLVRHVDERGLENVRIADVEAMRLLAALPDACIGRVFLLFPDPWPKRRHHKRRFVQPAALDALARVLADDAEFRFATDHGAYARWTLALVLAHDAFAWPAETADDWRRRPSDWPETRYEAAALAAGRRPVYLTFRRRPRRAE